MLDRHLAAPPLRPLPPHTLPHPAAAHHRTFSTDVTDWLGSEGYRIRCFRLQGQPRPLLMVRGASSPIVLHLLPTPRSSDAVLPASATVDLADAFAARQRPPLVHLWEDQWEEHAAIVRSRLLAKLGRYERVGASKTVVRRIGSAECDPFLLDNHLWATTKAHYAPATLSAAAITRSHRRRLVHLLRFLHLLRHHDQARYRYGLYRKGAEGELVAVATFSPRWKKRHADGSTSASHELIRYCSRRGVAVVRGTAPALPIRTVRRGWRRGLPPRCRRRGLGGARVQPSVPAILGRGL